MQLGLGSAGRTLQDGNTSWDAAVLPVADMWNQTIQRVRISNVVSPLGSGCVRRPPELGFFREFDLRTVLRFEHAGGDVLLLLLGGSMVLESDTLFNRAITFDSYRGPLQFVPHGAAIPDIRRVFLHETGHTLGLGHPDTGGQSVTAVMNSIVSNQEVLSCRRYCRRPIALRCPGCFDADADTDTNTNCSAHGAANGDTDDDTDDDTDGNSRPWRESSREYFHPHDGRERPERAHRRVHDQGHTAQDPCLSCNRALTCGQWRHQRSRRSGPRSARLRRQRHRLER